MSFAGDLIHVFSAVVFDVDFMAVTVAREQSIRGEWHLLHCEEWRRLFQCILLY